MFNLTLTEVNSSFRNIKDWHQLINRGTEYATIQWLTQASIAHDRRANAAITVVNATPTDYRPRPLPVLQFVRRRVFPLAANLSP